MLPSRSACKGTVAGLLISGALIPGVLLAGQLGVVDDNKVVINRPTIPVIPVVPVVPVIQTPVVVTPVVVTPVINATVAPPPAISPRGSNGAAIASPQASTPTTGSKQFSPFVGTIAGGTSVNPATPSSVIASIRSMDNVQRGQALAYIDKIIDNPSVPQSDKATFASIRNEVTGEQKPR